MMLHRSRSALAVALIAAVLVSLAPARAAAAVPVVVLDGTGYGHGVGLSQWGAEYLARTGRSAGDILATFYPGATLAEATGPVRVAVHRPPQPSTTLTFPQGGEVRSPLEGEQAPGFPVRVGPGGRVRVTFDGAYRVEALMSGQSAVATRYAAQEDPCPLVVVCPPPTDEPPTPSTPPTTAPPPGDDGGDEGGTDGGGTDPAPPPPGTAPAPAPASGSATSGAPVWAVPAGGGVTTVDDRGGSYRGVIEATGGGGLRLLNHVDVEDYLRGMAEVPGTWPAAAVQAQTVAARTYALRAVQSGGEICDDARCQVYSGAGAESPGQNAAVAATARQVLVFGGALAAAVYSADAGGVSATTAEGFGTPDGVYPYLTTVRYETDNPLPWHREVGLGDVAARLGYRGELRGVRVAEAGPSGRAMQVVLDGSAGDMSVDGRRFARSLGLRSTRFTVANGTAVAPPAPLPPPTADEIQAMPDEASELAQRPVARAGQLRLDAATPSGPAVVAAALPPALDPRRHPATLAAIFLAALVAGALVPVAMAAPRPGVPGWGRWRVLTRRS
jgi:stage II sporulation protein D